MGRERWERQSKERNNEKKPYWVSLIEGYCSMVFDVVRQFDWDHSKPLLSYDNKIHSTSLSYYINHLKWSHNFLSKYNAWKVFDKLSKVKEERIQKNKRNQSESVTNEQNKKPKTMMNDCVRPFMVHKIHGNKKINNANGIFLCTDARPTNTVKGIGFQNLFQPFAAVDRVVISGSFIPACA